MPLKWSGHRSHSHPLQSGAGESEKNHHSIRDLTLGYTRAPFPLFEGGGIYTHMDYTLAPVARVVATARLWDTHGPPFPSFEGGGDYTRMGPLSPLRGGGRLHTCQRGGDYTLAPAARVAATARGSS